MVYVTVSSSQGETPIEDRVPFSQLIAGVDEKPGINVHDGMSTKVVHAGRRRFSEPNNPQDFARRTKVVEELRAAGLIKPQGTYGLFAITHDGYQAAERIR